MRLSFVSKRFPQQRDLLTRPYGRFHHLPVELAKLGHTVQVQLVSHRGIDSAAESSAGVSWSSDDLRSLGPWQLYKRVMARAAAFEPDWVIALSDAPHGWLARRIAKHVGARLAIDAYDDYESYMPWNLPLHLAWRGALRRADLVTAAGPQLAALLQKQRAGTQSRVEIIPMAADPEFAPMAARTCRADLGLPDSAPLLGYSGGWGSVRGTEVLLEAFELIRRQLPDARLVLSGKPPTNVTGRPGVIVLGYLPDASMPMLLNALDVACVLGADSKFSRHSYPSKLCEAMACGTPVVASATDPIRWMLADDARYLVPLADPAALAERIVANLGMGRTNYPPQPGWPELARRLSALLEGPATPRS